MFAFDSGAFGCFRVLLGCFWGAFGEYVCMCFGFGGVVEGGVA